MKKLIAPCAFAVTLLSGTITMTADADTLKGPETLDDRCWQISFEDGFDRLSLRAETGQELSGDNWQLSADGRWRTQYIWPRDTIINNEMQYYITPELHSISPFSISNGILSITAQPTPRPLNNAVSRQPYVSGLLTSEKSFAQQYGRFEIRARVPAGQGLWSAFWLLPSFDQWPAGVAVLPEIDVMEHLGHEPRVFHTTLHTNQTGPLTSHPYDHTESVDLTKNFHTYSVVWDESSVNWYLDGQWRAAHPTPRDFTRPVHFLINLAVGGNWPGLPDARTQFPARLDVDYVRAYTAADC